MLESGASRSMEALIACEPGASVTMPVQEVLALVEAIEAAEADMGGGPRPEGGGPPQEGCALLDLPNEVLLIILEWVLRLDPLTLLGSVPAVCLGLRSLCGAVHGKFDLRHEWWQLDERVQDCQGEWRVWGALAASGLFPQTTGLWTFSESPLLDACNAGLLVAATRLVEEDVSKLDEEGWNGLKFTPLYTASQSGRRVLAQMLLDKGADVNHATESGQTALMGACDRRVHLDVMLLLLDKGADPDAMDQYRGTALFQVCARGHLEAVRLLVEKGVDVNKGKLDRWTQALTSPLQIATQGGHTEIVALLRSAGARE